MVNRRSWIGDPEEIVDDFFGKWLIRMGRISQSSYDVTQHRLFAYWLRRVFANTVKSRQKRLRKIREMEVHREFAEDVVPQAVKSNSKEAVVDTLHDVLDRITAVQREIFNLKVEGLNSRQIADRLRIKKDRVEYEVRTARKRVEPIAQTFFRE